MPINAENEAVDTGIATAKSTSAPSAIGGLQTLTCHQLLLLIIKCSYCKWLLIFFLNENAKCTFNQCALVLTYTAYTHTDTASSL